MNTYYYCVSCCKRLDDAEQAVIEFPAHTTIIMTQAVMRIFIH